MEQQFNNGTLYLIPCPIGTNSPIDVLPLDTLNTIQKLDHFFAENLKTTRHTLKACEHPKAIRELQIELLDKKTSFEEAQSYIQILKQGHDAGIMSEAGCPGVADPGSILVNLAHQNNIKVVPLIGPSSILLALMASGANGQNFAFHGYLPKEGSELKNKLKSLENESAKNSCTQIFIETPYRTNNLVASIIQHCKPKTLFCLAYNLNQSNEKIISKPIHAWKKNTPKFDKSPCVFILYA